MAEAQRVEASEAAEALVRAFLTAMEARDLERAQQMLGPGFQMRFPGAGVMRDLLQLVDWARGRYRRVGKTMEAVEVVAGRPATVWIRGWLHGEWPDGSTFEGIRFVDRFEVEDGLILRQDVWNDLAEVKLALAGSGA